MLTDEQLDALRTALRAITGNRDGCPYVDVTDTDDFVLDGHFTLNQLKAIVLEIQRHRAVLYNPPI